MFKVHLCGYKRYPAWLLFQPYQVGHLHLVATIDLRSEGIYIKYPALALLGVCSLRGEENKQCLFAVSMDLCCSKNYHRMNHNKGTGSWKLQKNPKKLCLIYLV